MRLLDGPSAAEFEALGFAALERIPAPLREQLSNVVLRVEEFASTEQLESLAIASRWELTGLYEGRPLPDRTIWESGEMPPVITLFRQPLLNEMRETGVTLHDLVRHVVIHEAGHHFGFSDEDMHLIEDSAD